MRIFRQVLALFGLGSPHSIDTMNSAQQSAMDLIHTGNALEDAGLLDLAMVEYDAARTLCPTFPIAHLNYGNLLLARAEVNAAIESYRTAIALDPDYAAAYFNMGNAYLRLDERNAAVTAYARAIELKPDFSEASIALECAVDELGELDDSESRLRRGLEKKIAMDPLCASARWSLAMAQIRPIYDNVEEIVASLHTFNNALTELDIWFTPDRYTHGAKVVGTAQPFHLAYHGGNRRALLAKYGQLCCRLMSASSSSNSTHHSRPLKKPGKLRIGFASAHIRDHSVWVAITKGWIKHLDRSLFEIHLFHLGGREDDVTASARGMVTHFVDTPRTMAEWSQAIVHADLDALIYPEIGMDTITTQLAAQRLAPVQMTSWGHPITCGLPTIDFFISADLLEPADAQRAYTENLVCLANLGVCVEPLNPKPSDLDLTSIGLSHNEPLLLCPGMPFKYNPRDDMVWANIAYELQILGSGRLVFFESHYKAMNQQFERRLRRCFIENNVDFDRTVLFIPKLPHDQFYGLMQNATLMLDSIGFSGFNTALQALECGLPVLAFEGPFMRGRLASALLHRMGLTESIATSAEDYVEKALRLTREPLAKEALRREIKARRGMLFNDIEPVRSLERFLLRVLT